MIIHVDRQCFDCENVTAKRQMQRLSFTYKGRGGSVILEAEVPVWVCGECGAETTDHEAESIRDAAVCEHVGLVAEQTMSKINESIPYISAGIVVGGIIAMFVGVEVADIVILNLGCCTIMFSSMIGYRPYGHLASDHGKLSYYIDAGAVLSVGLALSGLALILFVMLT